MTKSTQRILGSAILTMVIGCANEQSAPQIGSQQEALNLQVNGVGFLASDPHNAISLREPGKVYMLFDSILTLVPGEQTFWHKHPGDGAFILVSGTATMTEDDGCATVLNAGQSFFDKAGHAHNVVNTGTQDAVFSGMIFIPCDSPSTCPPVIEPVSPPTATCSH
jgi:hypothetical protein